MSRVLYETDWLASRPVFYNVKTGKASHNINDVIEYDDLEFHPEGFNNYLDFGYSVLEQTPVRHVKFLRHSSRLWVDEKGSLSVEYLDDPVDRWLDYRLTEDEIIELIRERVQDWELSVDGEIVIPTSGGYDSRLLNWCIRDKSRIRSFTYGISDEQSRSHEVVYAKRLSEILGTSWEQIPLGTFHQYFDCWDRLFGPSTHAHGMYHFEFYKQIVERVREGSPLLSGLDGDSWAGSRILKIPFPEQLSAKQLPMLGLTHGMNASSVHSVFRTSWSSRKDFLAQEKAELCDDRWKCVWKTRMKSILMHYLLTVPQHVGFRAWTPFHDIDLAMAMLNVDRERSIDRLWMKEFFQKVGLDLEGMDLGGTRQNTLNLQAMQRIPVRPLNVGLLQEVVEPEYVRWINRWVRKRGLVEEQFWRLQKVRKVGGALRRLGIRDQRLKAYFAYLTLRPIENLLQHRTIG